MLGRRQEQGPHIVTVTTWRVCDRHTGERHDRQGLDQHIKGHTESHAHGWCRSGQWSLSQRGTPPERDWLILMHLVLWMCFILCGDVWLTKNLKWKFQNQTVTVPFLYPPTPPTPYSLCLQTSPPPPSSTAASSSPIDAAEGKQPLSLVLNGAEVAWMFSQLLFQPFFCCNPLANDITVSSLFVCKMHILAHVLSTKNTPLPQLLAVPILVSTFCKKGLLGRIPCPLQKVG